LARPAKCNRGGIRLNRGLQGHRLGLPSPRGQSAPQRANGFRSLKDTWADTTTPHGRLMLTVLGGLAEFERELIHARTARAEAGQRPVESVSAVTAHQRQEAFQRLANGESQADMARTYAVHPATIGRMLGTAGSPFADASGAAA
jgi:DNA invertase Pin-like site-specific DNA recombinase